MKGGRRGAGARTRTWALPLAVALGGLGCPHDPDYVAPIHVEPRAAQRSLWIPSHAGDPKASGVHVLQPGEELAGTNAIGRPGDLILENAEVVFVIDQLGSGGAGFAESGGNVVDAADARTREDELGQVFTFFGVFPRQAVYESLTSGAEADGSAFVEAMGHELYAPELEVRTRYALSARGRSLLLRTVVQNRGDATLTDLTFGDAVQWGAGEKFAPGHALGFQGASQGPFVGGVGRRTSYALFAVKDDHASPSSAHVDATSGSGWTDTFQVPHVTLAPGAAEAYERRLRVGERPDTASLYGGLARAAGRPLGHLVVTLQEARGARFEAMGRPEGARLGVTSPDGAATLTLAASSSSPDAIEGDLTPGDYVITYAGGGGLGGLRPAHARVVAGADARVNLEVTGAGRLAFTCLEEAASKVERCPCKVTLEGEGATRSPDFGPAYSAAGGRNQALSADGAVDLAVAPGDYRVTVSRGPEYTLGQWSAHLEAGKTTGDAGPRGAGAVLRRVVDTRGYLAADLHQHTMLGADAPVSTRDRVIANVAEGVEVAVASEHNRVVDFTALIASMHLEGRLVSLAGDELTTDASRLPWGHANAFPLVPDPSRPRGGAPPVRDRTAHQVFEALRGAATGGPLIPVIQINHPRTGRTGYFDAYAFDRRTGLGAAPGYDPGFDALEVWNGRNTPARAEVLADYLALLKTGHLVTPTANTDTHGVVGQEAGYPRTYVAVADDGPLEGWFSGGAWPPARTADLVRGLRDARDVVLSNGPFVRVRTNGVGIGRVAEAKGGRVQVDVHVACAPWVQVDRVQIVRAVAAAVPGDTQPIVLHPDPGGGFVADAIFTLDARTDDAFVVIATGHTPLAPVLAGAPADLTPYAMTAATWIDGDADATSLTRKSAEN